MCWLPAEYDHSLPRAIDPVSVFRLRNIHVVPILFTILLLMVGELIRLRFKNLIFL